MKLESLAQNALENNLEGEPTVELESQVEDPDFIVKTSGTSGDGAEVHFTENDVNYFVENTANSFKRMGAEQEDQFINCGAPPPHLSGTSMKRGIEAMDAVSLTDHLEQYQKVFEEDKAEDATAISGLPALVEKTVENIENEYGTIKEAVPNLEKGFLVGEQITEEIRKDKKEKLGLNTLKEFYASSETDIMAVAVDESSKLVPNLDKFIFEIVQENGEIVDIRDADDGDYGRLAVSCPALEGVDMNRYLIGDNVLIHEEEHVPRMEVMGRFDDCFNLRGALIYESCIDSAVSAASEDPSWYAVEEKGGEKPNFYVCVKDTENFDNEQFFEKLYELAPAVSALEEWKALGDVDIKSYDAYDIPESHDMKNERIIERYS